MGAAQLHWKIHTPGKARGLMLGGNPWPWDESVDKDSPLLGLKWTILRWIFYRPSGGPPGSLATLTNRDNFPQWTTCTPWNLYLDRSEAQTQHLYLFRKTRWQKSHNQNISAIEGYWQTQSTDRLAQTCLNKLLRFPSASINNPNYSLDDQSSCYKVRIPWFVRPWAPHISVLSADLVCP